MVINVEAIQVKIYVKCLENFQLPNLTAHMRSFVICSRNVVDLTTTYIKC